MTIAESWQLDMEKPRAINGGVDKHSNGNPVPQMTKYHAGWSTEVFSLTPLTYFSCLGKYFLEWPGDPLIDMTGLQIRL